MKERLLSMLIGYLFGCFLTAEVVARCIAGKPATEIGKTGNPGMANIMEGLGFRPGILTLAGDLLKCVLSVLISHALCGSLGWIAVLYAGLGCTIGHDFPFWRRFRGGKGVATTSMAIALYAFIPALAANAAGLAVVLLSGYLCLGGPVIPLVFTGIMAVQGQMEAALLSTVLSGLALYSHGPAILEIRSGKTEKTDVIGAIRRNAGRGKALKEDRQ